MSTGHRMIGEITLSIKDGGIVVVSEVAVIGENLVDLIVREDGSTQAVVGGGPLNVARTVARLGGQVRLVSGVSSDVFGRRIRDLAAADGVVLARPAATSQPTTMAVVELTHGDAQYHFHLRDTAAFSVSEVSDLRGVDALYVGTLGLVVSPMAEASVDAVRDASPHTLVVLDPNCRPRATADREAYVSRVLGICPRADVVKVSLDDVAFLFPELTPTEAAAELQRAGTTLVVLSDGPAPLRALVGSEWLEIPVPPTKVVDTVGAGDSLVGAFVVWWLGHDLTRSDLVTPHFVEAGLRAAIEVSRRTCMVAGAEPPHLNDLANEPTWSWLRPASSTTPSTP